MTQPVQKSIGISKNDKGTVKERYMLTSLAKKFLKYGVHNITSWPPIYKFERGIISLLMEQSRNENMPTNSFFHIEYIHVHMKFQDPK